MRKFSFDYLISEYQESIVTRDLNNLIDSTLQPHEIIM